VFLTWRAVALALAGIAPVLVAPGPVTVLAWLAVLVAVVAADVSAAASPNSLSFGRELPPSVRLGEPVDAVVTATNHGRRRVRGLLRDAWQPSAGAAVTRHPLVVPAGERRRLSTRLVPRRRGDRLSPGVAVRSLGPLGVAGRQRMVDVPGRLRVLPPFRSRRHLPSRLAMLREIDGRAAIRVRGQGTEFDSLREYVIGDDVRSIDWRATARRSSMVVRTWRPERDRRVLLVVDASRTSAARVGDEPRVDAAIEAALLLGALASRAGDRVDLLVHDRRILGGVEGASRSDLLRRMVDVLAPVEPALVEADWPTVAAEIRLRLSRRSLVVLLTAVDAATAETGLIAAASALARRHVVVVASVSDPAVTAMAARRRDAERVYDAAAAIRARTDALTVTEWLELAGVDVVTADPEDLPPALADRYLALKAAGRL
jgi:uncharacterized protein (DUF58 family)